MSDFNKATLRLFRAINVPAGGVRHAVVNATVFDGYILDPRINYNAEMILDIEETVVLPARKANATFHETWNYVATAPIYEMVLRQLAHYFTTYGFEALGIYRQEFVYVPRKKLDIPGLDGSSDIPLVVIRGMTAEEISEGILKLASSGMALSEQTIEDIMVLVLYLGFNVKNLDQVRNNELLVRLCDYMNVAPRDPDVYLRYLIYELTGSALVVKDKKTIAMLQNADPQVLDTLLARAPKNLATIFLRQKPLFLAMKKASRNKAFFNDLRRKANTMHRPVRQDYLNLVTEHLARGTFSEDTLISALEGKNVWRKIRLYRALHNRMAASASVVYRVRNGKAWAQANNWQLWYNKALQTAERIVQQSIVEHLAHLKGKLILIPEHIDYALPSSEKQFVGGMPVGTRVSVEGNMVCGVHWTNLNDDRRGRVDLDLSLVMAGLKIGWNGAYRSNGVLFSGDIVDAPLPNGAAELHHIDAGTNGTFLSMVNWFNRGTNLGMYDNCAVDARVLFSQGHDFDRKNERMVDPNLMLFSLPLTITETQTLLGLVDIRDGVSSFYIVDAALGNNISARGDKPHMEHSRRFYLDTLVNRPGLADFLIMANAAVVRQHPSVAMAKGDITYDVAIDPAWSPDIDLSPGALTKTSIIDLFSA